jgi:hypothetical protein
VFLVHKDMMRGFDMRKGCDAKVHIVLYDDKIAFSKIMKMAGRGNRTQGKADCAVWTTDV